MKEENMYLISVKPKKIQDQGLFYVVDSASLSGFIDKHLTPDVVLLIDTIDVYTAEL